MFVRYERIQIILIYQGYCMALIVSTLRIFSLFERRVHSHGWAYIYWFSDHHMCGKILRSVEWCEFFEVFLITQGESPYAIQFDYILLEGFDIQHYYLYRNMVSDLMGFQFFGMLFPLFSLPVFFPFKRWVLSRLGGGSIFRAA